MRFFRRLKRQPKQPIVQPVTLQDVKAAELPNKAVAREANLVGLSLMRVMVEMAKTSRQIREELASDALHQLQLGRKR